MQSNARFPEEIIIMKIITAVIYSLLIALNNPMR